ncbi:MAG: hypothetical protein C7B43_11690 [Sulfobacillus benefaciens]|uniref:Uncharacterized protein n=1 Tax=Sulfobacillus benefaciens TaxID=453960 RepID=A0A2T2WYS7_9FIRM|nr:MAG: hypothetical protein C7B43_11690 [Sulfobacillus benefaciens]HBQ96298.1 hypothetical protein [Sulfobacillus sp.]
MCAPETPTPIGKCLQCVLIRPGVFYLVTDTAQAILCYPRTAKSFFTSDILALAQPWERWLLFTGLGFEKILNLWPAWGETLAQQRHKIITQDVRRLWRGRS